MSIVIVRPDRTIEEIKDVDGEPSLEQLQEWVGGYIELVPITSLVPRQMYVDEEGTLKDLPLNAIACEFAGQRIVGNAVLLDLNNILKGDE